ncbi:unnamed protein product [Aphanomyces euteiches]|uniref:Uncharacterized protein n=1 Tax=Aphanomyces euteiches TaxID=100861 RepID=A0A6G0X7W0_9STRA|nr:hypothetical protein Ae201684_007622 [Aphanomyces euteiches]KAH9067164.1 hypothetical protein Ae201684P_021330 [Aphanomyces euteiches]
MNFVDDWNIAAELAFVMPTIEEIDVDFISVCELITAEDDQLVELTKTKRKRASHAHLHHARIDSLQSQIRELEDQLQVAKNTHALKRNDCRWAVMARRLSLEVRKALRETRELQAAVDLNQSYIDNLVSLLRKRPRVEFRLLPVIEISPDAV